MCFSATASFAASAVIGAGGLASLKRATQQSQRAFATIPLFFALQQAVEGVIWLTFGLPGLQRVFMYAYLLFSHVFWPVFLPFAVRSLETHTFRRQILSTFGWFGLAIGLYLSYFIVRGPAAVSMSGHGLAYHLALPDAPAGIAAYVVATCAACLISSKPFVRVFGLTLFASFIIAYWSYQTAFYSVWCFFAALLSLIVYAHFRQDDLLRAMKKVKSRMKDLDTRFRK